MAPTPDIDGEACVHALAPHASCRACAEACPANAWILDDDGLALDTAACDGCGLCVPACPRGAITMPREVIRLFDGHGRGQAFAACEQAPANPVPPLPCAHALGLRDLDTLARDKVARLHVLTGECRDCARRPPSGSGLAAAAERHRLVRTSRGEAAVSVEMSDPVAFRRAHARAVEDRDRVDRSRRRLFGALLDAPPAPRPLAAAALAAHAPHIDIARCVICDACIRICPDGALSRQTNGTPAYAITPDACTGCNLCINVCDQAAVTVQSPGPAAPTRLVLDPCRCRACGAPYNVFAAPASEGDRLCRICAATRRHKTLFQVLKDV